MTKPYHLMTPAERIAARIAQNKEIDQRVKESASVPAASRGLSSRPAKDFSRIGHAFLDSLPDMEKGSEAKALLNLARERKDVKK